MSDETTLRQSRARAVWAWRERREELSGWVGYLTKRIDTLEAEQDAMRAVVEAARAFVLLSHQVNGYGQWVHGSQSEYNAKRRATERALEIALDAARPELEGEAE